MKMVVFSWLLLFGGLLVIFGQVFRLQVVLGKDQALRAEQNRFRVRMLPAERGGFFDISGEALVDDSEGRRYIYPEEFAHVLGYTGEADEKELVYFGVEMGSKVGKMGLEREENGILSGVNGGVVEEYSADGEKLRALSETKPVAGRSLQLTIDKDMQNLAYKLLKESGFYGSVIVSTANNNMMAIASYPSFDPNLFGKKIEDDDKRNQLIGELLEDERMPMFFRAIGGVYPPASTFKIVTAIGALEENVVDSEFEIDDHGFVQVGGFRYGNWYYDQYGRTEGKVNMVKALSRSNDTYFYLVGEMLGIDKLASWARKFGFGESVGIHLDGESKGLVPDKNWKEIERGEDWYLGDTYITSIGQGNLQTTPVQIHTMTAAVANRGKKCEPNLIAAAVDGDVKPIGYEEMGSIGECADLGISEGSLDIVVEGMKKACDVGGTGWPLFNFSVKNDQLLIDDKNVFKAASKSASFRHIPVACKTGTAETGRSEWVDGKQKWFTHAWFVAFAPIEDPEIVVTVMLEDAGQGSDKAAPLAKKIFEEWFGDQLSISNDH